jgi:hypothetical protein
MKRLIFRNANGLDSTIPTNYAAIGFDTLGVFSIKQNNTITPIGSDSRNIWMGTISQTSVSQTSGLLTIGNTYIINNLVGGDDFSNVGYTTPESPFQATGTTPESWSNETLVFDITSSEPVIDSQYPNRTFDISPSLNTSNSRALAIDLRAFVLNTQTPITLEPGQVFISENIGGFSYTINSNIITTSGLLDNSVGIRIEYYE